MTKQFGFLILAAGLCAGGLHASVVYNLISNRDFPGPADVQQVQSGTLTSTTSDSLHVSFSSNPGDPNANTYDGTASISAGPFALVTHNAVTIGTPTTTFDNFLSVVAAGIDESGVTITGGSGSGFLLPTFHVFGVMTDSSPNASVSAAICAGNGACNLAGLFGPFSAGVHNVDGFYTPMADSTTSFQFGTPFEFFFAYSGAILTSNGNPGGPVTSELTLQFVGFQVVDAAGQPIRGAQIHSQFLDAASTPEPGTAGMFVAALSILGTIAARKKTSERRSR